VVAEAMWASVAAMTAVIGELNHQIDRHEAELADRFQRNPDAKIIRSQPGRDDPGRPGAG
jgi:hypothetical protein